MNLLKLLKSRLDLSKKFTKDFQDQVKRDLSNYKADRPDIVDIMSLDTPDAAIIRYFFPVPLIQQYHEGMMASTFQRVPDLVIRAKGKLDDEKQLKVKAAYEYLQDKLHLEQFLLDSAWWFYLSGFVTSNTEYKSEYREVPVLDDLGQPQVDEMGEPVTRIEYLYDDPIIEVNEPEKMFFSPESKFSVEGDKVPYYFRKVLMTVEEVERTFKKDVEADSKVDTEEAVSEDNKKEMDRVGVYLYSGKIPEENKGQVKEWDYKSDFYIAFTEKKVLHKEKVTDSSCKIGKWKGSPSEFFGHGLGKLLADVQREKSIRRGQMVRWGDVAAFPKIAVKNDGNDIDLKALSDPRENVAMLYTQEPPQYLTPPPISDTLIKLDQSADLQAQQISGMLDLSNGAQTTNTVDTATGQTIFADAAEKRVNLAKKLLMNYYKANVIRLLKLCQSNWNEDKLINIMDQEGNASQISVSRSDLSDVDFDTDIDIDQDSTTVNKDVLRQQSIAFYDKTKDDPIIERKSVVLDMLRNGFEKPNAESFIKSSNLTPGMNLMGEDGQQFTVDESGSVVPAEDMSQLAQPSGTVPSM